MRSEFATGLLYLAVMPMQVFNCIILQRVATIASATTLYIACISSLNPPKICYSSKKSVTVFANSCM